MNAGQPPVTATPGINPTLDLADWRAHRFGLSEQRWSALAGKAAWITGAGTGFGRSMAIGLAAAKAHVFLTGRRAEKLHETLEEMERNGISSEHCKVIPADITEPDAVAEAIREIDTTRNPLSYLINNAGTVVTGLGPWPLQDMLPDDWDVQFDLNVKAQWMVTKAALPKMLEQDEIRILFVTSEAGWADTPAYGHYNVSKCAMNSLSASYAAECAARFPEKDIQINTVIPGEARTEMNQGSTISPYSICSVVFALLSHPRNGPNGRFFFRDGRHFPFAYTEAYNRHIL